MKVDVVATRSDLCGDIGHANDKISLRLKTTVLRHGRAVVAVEDGVIESELDQALNVLGLAQHRPLPAKIRGIPCHGVNKVIVVELPKSSARYVAIDLELDIIHGSERLSGSVTAHLYVDE